MGIFIVMLVSWSYMYLVGWVGVVCVRKGKGGGGGGGLGGGVCGGGGLGWLVSGGKGAEDRGKEGRW